MKDKSNKKNKNYYFIFYWNPHDKRIFVPKKSGLGLTINFANPLSIIILFALFIAVSLITSIF